MNLIASVYAGKHAGPHRVRLRLQFAPLCRTGAESKPPPRSLLALGSSSHSFRMHLKVQTSESYYSPYYPVECALFPLPSPVLRINHNYANFLPLYRGGDAAGAASSSGAALSLSLFVGCLHNFPPFIVQLIFVLVAGSRFAFA